MIQLINGDCVDSMKNIQDETIDLTVTSPPYDNLRTYNGNNAQWGENVWKAVIKELFRVTKHGGVVIWVVGDATIKGSETGTSFRQALWAKECGFALHDTMIYEKNSSTFPSKTADNRYTQIFEYMFVFAKGKISSKLICDKPNAEAGKRYGIRKTFGGKEYTVPEFSPRTNIWKFTTSLESSKLHTAIFPYQLAYDHIVSWSNEEDIVLDTFMGSGTTGIACVDLNRNFIGIELDEQYYAIAKQRINEKTKEKGQ